MSLMFSKGCQNAIRSLVYLTEREGSGPQPIREVARALNVPYQFLAKVIQDLARKELIVSQKGVVNQGKGRGEHR